ncbi:MAG: SAM-dependent chlorinase/fluorinase [Bacteroidetes bacterium]|nr:SAM-dependent chlorinase/fluorinase [Bacteroidota bacterium]
MLLSFTSDFGSGDHLVGGVKGEIVKLNEGFQIIDITHDIIPYNFMQAAYVCKNIFKAFPPESFHLIMINVFDNDLDHLLLVRHGGQVLGMADNGLITMMLGGRPDEAVAIPIPPGSKKGVRLFASVLIEAFNKVASGMAFDKIGDAGVKIQEKAFLKTFQSDQYIEGQILMIDRFANVIVNITREEFEASRRDRPFKIVLLRDVFIDRISRHYADVSEGEKLAFFNEAGYLEIAVNKGHAAPLFGLGEYHGAGPGTQGRRQYYQTVKVFFE